MEQNELMKKFSEFMRSNLPNMMKATKELINTINGLKEKHAVFVRTPNIENLEIGMLGCRSKKNIKKAIKIMEAKEWEAHNRAFDPIQKIHIAFMVRKGEEKAVEKKEPKKEELIKEKIAGMAN